LNVKSALRTRLLACSEPQEVYYDSVKKFACSATITTVYLGVLFLICCDFFFVWLLQLPIPITQIRFSMEKTLQWIVPVANNTARYFSLDLLTAETPEKFDHSHGIGFVLILASNAMPGHTMASDGSANGRTQG
jgi:hypothetical protein